MKQYAYFAAITLFFFLLLCFPSETFQGASNGLLLWFQTILPTLLPFSILSNILIYSNSVFLLAKCLSPVLTRLFTVSPCGSYAIFIGFLCGYPMGAKVVSDLLSQKLIRKNEAMYLLSFCNNTSPIFIISFVVLQSLNRPELVLPTLGILLLSPILCSFLFRHFYKTTPENLSHRPQLQFSFQIIDDGIMNSFETLTKVGGYIILFSILCALLKEFPYLLPSLEISNGIYQLAQMKIPFPVQYVSMLALTSFGGFCAIAQTSAMVQMHRIPLLPYIIEKLITAMVTSFLGMLYVIIILR